MPMPQANVNFEELTPTTPVTLEGETNRYYVATIDGTPKVVIMTGHKQKAQQQTLDQMVHDTKMRNKGYRYRLTPQDNSFAPLYAKTLQQCGELMRSYPKHKFDTVTIA